ncbi:MAG: OsmC family protein [Candidatus Delongbacteria bacterium]|nr:OsmC family protein [Candidatus Delongbacteria bacterium]
MSDLKFRIKAESENPTKMKVKARGFEFTIDEPKDLGGTDSAANPVEYLLGAFAGCLNVMGHLIAGEMGFTLKSLKIDMAGDLNPAMLFGQPTEDRAGYKNIEVKLRPECDADEETLEAWKLAIASRCPVCDNLKHLTPVELKVKARQIAVEA